VYEVVASRQFVSRDDELHINLHLFSYKMAQITAHTLHLKAQLYMTGRLFYETFGSCHSVSVFLLFIFLSHTTVCLLRKIHVRVLEFLVILP